MKFKVRVGDSEGAWEEEYDKPEVKNPEEWGRSTVDQFNAGLRPGERPRIFFGVTRMGPSDVPGEEFVEHEWEKTNLVTLASGGDAYRCKNCGVTGLRRLITTWPPRLDSQFKGPVFKNCLTAKAAVKALEQGQSRFEKGKGCGPGKHDYIDRGTYLKCSKCGASRSKKK
jgi:hypothetical protein